MRDIFSEFLEIYILIIQDFLNVWLQMHVTGKTNGTPGDGNLSQVKNNSR